MKRGLRVLVLVLLAVLATAFYLLAIGVGPT